MTINANSLIQESTLNRMVQLAFRGQNQNPDLLDSALGVLNKCGFNEEQTAKIAQILRHVPSDIALQATSQMKERILAVLIGKDEVIEVVQEKQVECQSALQTVPMKQKCVIDFTRMQKGPFLQEHIFTIFFECQSKGDWEGIGAMACASKEFYLCATKYWNKFDLKLFSESTKPWFKNVDQGSFCEGLTILDAKTLGITVDDEPCINKLAVLKCFQKLVPHIQGMEGLTLLTMTKGLTLNQLVKIAAEAGMEVDIRLDQFLQELGDVPVEQTYVILITNNVFVRSINQFINRPDIIKVAMNEWPQEHERCVAGYGCEMPTIQEYVALCVFTQKLFQKYAYKCGGKGRSSTKIEGYSLSVGWSGGSDEDLNVHLINESCFYCHPFGVGGRKEF